MNHKELIAKLSTTLDMPKIKVERLLDITVQTWNELLVKEQTIGLQGFGNFEVRKKEKRVSVHPITKARTIVPSKLVVSFKQSNILKEKLKEIPKS